MMPEYYYEKCYDFMDHVGMSQEPSGPMHHTWSAGLIQGMPNAGCILKEGNAFKKYLCPGPKSDQLSQNHWEWGSGISMF